MHSSKHFNSTTKGIKSIFLGLLLLESSRPRRMKLIHFFYILNFKICRLARYLSLLHFSPFFYFFFLDLFFSFSSFLLELCSLFRLNVEFLSQFLIFINDSLFSLSLRSFFLFFEFVALCLFT